MREQEITALLADHKEEGMDALLRHYGPLMRYVIGGILQDPRDREECLSETAMQVPLAQLRSNVLDFSRLKSDARRF